MSIQLCELYLIFICVNFNWARSFRKFGDGKYVKVHDKIWHISITIYIYIYIWQQNIILYIYFSFATMIQMVIEQKSKEGKSLGQGEKILHTSMWCWPYVIITSVRICGQKCEVLLIWLGVRSDLRVSTTCNISLPPSELKCDHIWLSLLSNSRCSQG